MEGRENERNMLQEQVPWVPSTPLRPILSRPVPIWAPGVGNQLCSHPNGIAACFETLPGGETNNWAHHWLEPAALAHDNATTRVPISFDDIPSSSNGNAAIFNQADATLAYSHAAHDGFLNQFVPTYSQFNPAYSLLGQHQHLTPDQPFVNTIHDKYQNLQVAGTSYFTYYGNGNDNAFLQIAPPPDNTVTPEGRQDAVAQRGPEEKNAPATTECNDQHSKLYDPVTGVADVSTQEENSTQRKEISHDFDLNETPQPKPPKRRKHRPKVIRESKPKTTSKQVTTKPVQSKENPTGKRTMRRKGLNAASTSQTEVTAEQAKSLMPESAKKACKRSLNFDIGEQPRDDDSSCRENATIRFDRDTSVVVEETQGLYNCVSLLDTQAPSTYISKCNSPVAKSNANYTEISSSRVWMIGQDGHENSTKILSKSVAHSSPNDSSNSSNSKLLSRGSTLHVVGSKRKQSGIQQAHNGSINLVGAQYNAMHAYCQNYGVQFPNVQKKRRSEKGRNTSYKSSVTGTNDVLPATCPQQDARSLSYASSPNCWTSAYEYNAAGGVPVTITTTERAIHDKPQPSEYNLSSGQRRTPTKRRSRVPTRTQDCALLTITRNCDTKLAHTAKQTCSSDRQTFGDAETPQTCIDALVAELGASLTKKKRTRKRSIPVSSAYFCTNEMTQHDKVPAHNSLGARKYMHTVDALIEQFRRLNIYTEAGELVLHGQNNHEDGTIIPYKGPPIKKQRPKVDLDEETNKVWNLLMLDIKSHGIDGTDEDKAKWWEEERNVFRGRADSFIARMHLVQGDRRFSPWKGSVVDSVVGVFLTQNVSDHLSSSAFMSLAARFPLPSSTEHNTCHTESTSMIVKESQVYIVEPEENNKLDEKISAQSVCELNSITIETVDHSDEREAADSNYSCRTTDSLIRLTDESYGKLLESSQRHSREHSPVECGAISAVTGGQEKLCQGSVRKELNDVFSPQCSAVTSQISGDLSIDQNPEKIGSFSNSNSEIEELSNSAKYNIYYNRTSFRELLEMASSTMLRDPNSGILEVNCYDPLKLDVPSSGFSKDKDENNKRTSFPTESDSQATIANSQGQTQDTMQKARALDFGDHNSAMGNENSKIDSAPVKKRGRKLGKKKNNKFDSDSLRIQAQAKAGKREKTENKKNKFDWDGLRIQAQAKAGKREKTENTMDSLDWDAVRCADVNEIADVIKERGMNNMLAERIKNFLNLLVDKHEGIDLEWLRDVPPDQAKEYLLSIKGLGLKSVECVRLLTLHHLAFPVDTNVGRIAVRLGWVPLQPLPESLQLHLLELYPVLESIQKYLWPRLCKLDQRTLYELHYQLITFGKVFCTKSKPNCNACPMRGECRHFASAFASARLALPGPEQKSIVVTTGNNATEQNPSVVINQLPLLLPENTNQVELQQTELIRQLEAISGINTSQPIIEEPATPEPECSKVSENDIEDTFNEESCEIPTIKLDIEEFTLNLQNYMQDNMELQEGEMSKALVALSPGVACIPTPKLKNVSRLRTEHYVYELPDSHPLLEGWEKREPDDPGKYLLAIWTPGETADSIQPPERKCSSQDCGQLCCEKECFSCNSYREANSQIVRGTLLIPCRTAMRGSFPLNGTYFQVNEVFADNDSSLNPISVPRSWIWNLNRRQVYFGTSVSSIFKGLSTREIQQCFWRGYVCVRGFDRESRAPRPLLARLHFPVSRQTKNKDKAKKQAKSAKSAKSAK